LKFSDVIIATASLILLGFILDTFLMVAFGSLSASSTSDTLAFVISVLVASLIVGYVFALNIQDESRIKATGVIAVLSAFTLLILFAIVIANNFAYPWMQDSLNSMFNKTTEQWTHYDLNAYAALTVSVQVIIGLVISFVGLYIGSMLKKPSARTK
jgi:hypothetical protein